MKDLMTKVYAYMCAGLGVTAVVGYLTSLLFVPPFTTGLLALWIVAAIVELCVVWYFSRHIKELDFKTALLIFTGYSALSGFTITPIFALYTVGSVFWTFLATTSMFGIMSVVGYVTKKDLSSMGNILFMCLIGLIIATVINIFVACSWLYWLVTYAGILIFIGLTVYDTQKIKEQLSNTSLTNEEYNKSALDGALELYLDFINLFLMLLRIFGDLK